MTRPLLLLLALAACARPAPTPPPAQVPVAPRPHAFVLWRGLPELLARDATHLYWHDGDGLVRRRLGGPDVGSSERFTGAPPAFIEPELGLVVTDDCELFEVADGRVVHVHSWPAGRWRPWGEVVVDGGWIYLVAQSEEPASIVHEHAIVAIPRYVDPGAIVLPTGGLEINDIDVHDGVVYWSAWDRLVAGDPVTGAVTTLATSSAHFSDVVAGPGWVYTIDQARPGSDLADDRATIARVPRDGGALEPIAVERPFAGLALIDGRPAWRSDGTLRRASRRGAETIAQLGDLRTLDRNTVVDGDRLLIARSGPGGGIVEVGPRGAVSLLADGLGDAARRDLVVVGGRLYLATSAGVFELDRDDGPRLIYAPPEGRRLLKLVAGGGLLHAVTFTDHDREIVRIDPARGHAEAVFRTAHVDEIGAGEDAIYVHVQFEGIVRIGYDAPALDVLR